MTQRTFAFIFARGGSKGLPGKNIKEFCGTPLLAHSIRLANAMTLIERVFVSTDDAQIAEVATQYGATLINRPAVLATDTSSEWLAWRHAVEHVRALGLDFDVFLSLPTTSPLRSELDVINCLVALQADTDAVISVTPAERSPYFNMVSTDQEGFAHILLSSTEYKRRQDVPLSYDLTTVAYVARPNFIMQQESLFAGRVRPVIVPKERAIDIDDEIDFKIAEFLFKK